MPAHSETGIGPVRRSLVESTAEAFRRATLAGPTLAGPPAVPAVAAGAGSAAVMAGGSGLAGSDAPMLIRRSLSGSLLAAGSPELADHGAEVAAVLDSRETFDVSRLPARDFHRLVDAIVEAVEQRVVDELERRGRRHPGVF